MEIVIVNSSDTFEYRVDMLYSFFKKKGAKVTVITSDFKHIEKTRRKCENPDFKMIHVPTYHKNISIQRIYSHIYFSIKASKMVKAENTDLLYIVAPPNSQTWLARRYRHKNTRVVIDIIDMWPESFPSSHTDRFPFTLWGRVRNRNLGYADRIITECNLYGEILDKYIKDSSVETIYWAHKQSFLKINRHPEPDSHKLNLCYLGSINNIIDIPQIVEIIQKIMQKTPVVLRVIGDGEKREQLLTEARSIGAEVIYYGKIYDMDEKQKIFNQCHFGLNIMKETVCIGLSMKSIDYLEGGLPIINNLSADLGKLIDQYHCGVNVYSAGEIVYKEDMRLNARKLFEDKFSQQAFEEKVERVL